MAATITSGRAADETPTRRRVAFAVALAAWAIWKLGTAETVVWGAVAVGFVGFSIATGPAAATSIGSRIGAWVRAIGETGRAATIVAFVFFVSAVLVSLHVSTTTGISFACGGVLGTIAVVAVETGRSHFVTASD
ncbi:hypothetical protein [Natrinema salifodinae]|uniref:Uncharacterized protein n=1 Tax=Natrinema salifodinae TaxID=1202768 RepID=A0A1I0QFE2_9EURY|nr:hypothetical protein [Natrinema salifodinae]SEW25770.1 hypothetical protein SAMN05216285_3495 [Natrinema salifodinae]